MSIRERRAITAGEELLLLIKLADRRVFFSSASLLVPFVYEWGVVAEDFLRLFLYTFSSAGVVFCPLEGDMLLLGFNSGVVTFISYPDMTMGYGDTSGVEGFSDLFQVCFPCKEYDLLGGAGGILLRLTTDRLRVKAPADPVFLLSSSSVESPFT